MSIDCIIQARMGSNRLHEKILIDKVKDMGYDVFIGSEDDVLDRYYQAAKKYSSKIIVRVTSDCPLIDPEVIDEVIKAFLEQACEYCTNVLPPTFPDGLDVEVFSFEVLEKVWNEATLISEREHVTTYLLKNIDKFNTYNVKNSNDYSYLRLTIDYEEDFELIKHIIQKIKKSPIIQKDILTLFEKEPELAKINSKYSRNEGYTSHLKEQRIVK